jgi:branched-chain amino acid aminotransferase
VLLSQEMTDPRYAWLDGRLIQWPMAAIHVDTQAVLGGLNVFEVVGCFSDNASTRHFFRWHDHLSRLRRSAKIMRIDVPYSDDELLHAARELMAANEFSHDAGLRIVAYVGSGPLFSDAIPTGMFIIAREIGQASLEMLNVCSASWVRLADTVAPPRVKAGANYHNVRLAQLQARLDGYDDAIMLNTAGKVCELPLANLFVGLSGTLVTPNSTSGILEGITRDTILRLAKDIGVPTVEREVDRSELFTADEVFSCGTLVRVNPIGSVDRFCISDGRLGALTRVLAEELEKEIRWGPRHSDWLTKATEG